MISQYVAGNKTNQSKVIFCFDCDDYDSKPEDAEFLTNVKQYCAEKGYDFIWFCKDIERVYLGKRSMIVRRRGNLQRSKQKN